MLHTADELSLGAETRPRLFCFHAHPPKPKYDPLELKHHLQEPLVGWLGLLDQFMLCTKEFTYEVCLARVTVEDCVDKVPNRFELVLLAAHRARAISSGAAHDA
jgi:hypothetical protein